MDEISNYEINLIIENQQYRKRTEYDVARWVVQSIVQQYSKKQLKLTDVAKFIWDNETETKNKKTWEETKKDIERLKKESADVIARIKKL